MIRLAARSNLSFDEIIDIIKDGKGYKFSTAGLKGYFYKAPFPDQASHTARDGALSAITYWEDGKKARPTLMLYDFTDTDWSIEACNDPSL